MRADEADGRGGRSSELLYISPADNRCSAGAVGVVVRSDCLAPHYLPALPIARGVVAHLKMKQNQIEINGAQLTISTKKAPVFIMITLTLLLSILTLIPIAVTFFVYTYGDGPHIGIAFSFILCWGVGFYLLRVTLWNSVGREILTLNPEKISYIADYKLFRDGRQEITTKDLETEIIYEDKPNKPLGRLRLKNKTTSIETTIQTTLTEMEELINEIKTRYNNGYKT